jgi:hypothetical protein
MFPRLVRLLALLIILPFAALFAALAITLGILILPGVFAKYQCVPPDYPALLTSPMTTGTPIKSFTTDGIEKVRDAYVSLLNAVPSQEELTKDKLWKVERVKQDYLLQCYNSPTHLDLECGGILLVPTEAGTSIERVWHVSEGMGCEQFLEVPKEYFYDGTGEDSTSALLRKNTDSLEHN